MNKLYNEKLKMNARNLRKSMTKEERHLWYDCLKKLPVTIHRQKPFGSYIADFYIAAARLIIEVDGTQHFEDAGRLKDVQRDVFFRKQGFTVVRYSNYDVNRNFDAVCQDIWNRVMEAGITAKPSPLSNR